ncbi:hypothetical protein GH714_024445 [Hevea brasiliensis]|uniref:Photosystem I PsaL reaction centre subunit XI domain-containing protein n=1 Tax=Hevea brasiliensis TaxID=3981 RepID=A0A6A6KYF9_HEVBR|nr:hypothetical protein GH714_024445 [Hevea brasiliensis]
MQEQQESLAAGGLVVILSICLTMYGIASFSEGEASTAPSLTLTGRKKEPDQLQTADGWAKFSGGFFFGGISGVIWAYFLLYVLNLPYFVNILTDRRIKKADGSSFTVANLERHEERTGEGRSKTRTRRLVIGRIEWVWVSLGNKSSLGVIGPMISEKQKLYLRRFLVTICLLSAALFIGTAFVITGYYKEKFSFASIDAVPVRDHAWKTRENPKKPTNLLAMAVGIKQKENVNKIVKKFPSSDFVVMLFHYDGIVDEWKDLEWSRHAIHLAATNQTKWWFAKRFLHPDIVSEYAFIFLWDEDIGVDNFDPGRYLKIIKEERFEISQPALDPNRSEVHHQLTKRHKGSRVHRRVNRRIGRSRCDKNVTGPPCSGFVEMMAPVFSKASWRCAWYMIQNDLVHGWGVDFQLGYCAQAQPLSKQPHDRQMVKNWSYVELEIFKNRWRKAASNDHYWTDPYRS